MLRHIHETAFHRIIVELFDLLQEHLLILNQFRMHAFLPDLIVVLGLVFILEKRQLILHPFLIKIGPICKNRQPFHYS